MLGSRAGVTVLGLPLFFLTDILLESGLGRGGDEGEAGGVVASNSTSSNVTEIAGVDGRFLGFRPRFLAGAVDGVTGVKSSFSSSSVALVSDPLSRGSGNS